MFTLIHLLSQFYCPSPFNLSQMEIFQKANGRRDHWSSDEAEQTHYSKESNKKTPLFHTSPMWKSQGCVLAHLASLSVLLTFLQTQSSLPAGS